MRTVIAAVIVQDKKILLVKIKEVWILPGGQLKKDETEIECLNREVSEELPEFKINNLKFYKAFKGRSPHQSDFINVKVYFATGKGNIKSTNDVDEVNKSKWIKNTADYNLSDVTKKIIDSLKNDRYF